MERAPITGMKTNTTSVSGKMIFAKDLALTSGKMATFIQEIT